jgi:5-formyltetrahydrofolate cyclo-ligase
MNSNEVQEKSKAIIDKLKNDNDYIKAKTVMFYVSKGNEVFTHDIIKEIIGKKKVVVPKMVDHSICCCKLDDFDDMNESSLGILEPINEIKCDVSEIELIIVPGIVFDREGHRIGYGGGYYDKLLKDCNCKKIGLAFDLQIVNTIPADEWDEEMDKVISD